MLRVIHRIRQAFTAEAAGKRRSRRGLSRLSPEAIGKAINETDKQVNGIMLAFIGATAFCPTCGQDSAPGHVSLAGGLSLLLHVNLDRHGHAHGWCSAENLGQRSPFWASCRRKGSRRGGGVSIPELIDYGEKRNGNTRKSKRSVSGGSATER
jgi:hypothetical protein